MSIQYICLSDLHFGQEDSLLTNLQTASRKTDPLEASPVLKHLVNCLKELVAKAGAREKPVLILNGDVLELALTTTNEAIMCFERFVELALPGNEADWLFSEIIYVPGNHDHHLWEIARETQYANHILKIPPKTLLPIPWHATKMLSSDVESYMLVKLLQRYDHLKDFQVKVAYPNLALKSSDNSKTVVFTHGHYIESIYKLVSTLKTLFFPEQDMPKDIYKLEAENFAWIDFFWSSMGRSGEAGKDVEIIYNSLSDKDKVKKLLHNLAKSLAEKYNLPLIPGDWAEEKVLNWAFNMAVDHFMSQERTVIDSVLSKESEKGLKIYMNEYLVNQMKEEGVIDRDVTPTGVTLLFGHTHKPFSDKYDLKNFEGKVDIYNTGGWVVDTEKPEPLHGGAIALLDGEMNSVLVRMYNENSDTGEYRVKVEDAEKGGGNPLLETVQGIVDTDSDPWKSFSQEVATAVHRRAQNLTARINEG